MEKDLDELIREKTDYNQLMNDTVIKTLKSKAECISPEEALRNCRRIAKNEYSKYIGLITLDISISYISKVLTIKIHVPSKDFEREYCTIIPFVHLYQF